MALSLLSVSGWFCIGFPWSDPHVYSRVFWLSWRLAAVKEMSTHGQSGLRTSFASEQKAGNTPFDCISAAKWPHFVNFATMRKTCPTNENCSGSTSRSRLRKQFSCRYGEKYRAKKPFTES
ncbi:hypothetical protein HED49_01805 [Ochrobactrum daejeonense]|nr:hypothetical protein [Brucella daejeonensis]